jgi:hypothetical protein
MKKIFALLLLSVFTLPFLAAQENVFAVGDKVVNLGIGFGNILYSGLGYKTSVPPVSISFEKGIKDGVLDKGVIGVGGYLGYSANKYEYFGYGWKYSNIILGARGVFHYPLVDKIDTYAGVLLGYRIVTSKEIGTTLGGVNPSSGGGLVLSGYIGGRYYLTDNLAAMGELGYGISWINIGVSIKL